MLGPRGEMIPLPLSALKGSVRDLLRARTDSVLRPRARTTCGGPVGLAPATSAPAYGYSV